MSAERTGPTLDSDRCDRHHLEAFTRQRKVNRQLGLCKCGARPEDPRFRTCAKCRVWASWRKRCQLNPALRLDYRTRQFVAGYVDHGNAARAVREAELGTGLGARRNGYQLLRKPYIRNAIEDLKAAILKRGRQATEDEARLAKLQMRRRLDRLGHVLFVGTTEQI